MRIAQARRCSVVATFMSILVAVLLAATGCAPRVVGTRHVPDGNDMATMIKNGEIPYKNDVPAIALTGAGTYIANFSATLKVTGVVNTRMVMGETTSLVSSDGREPHHVFVVFISVNRFQQRQTNSLTVPLCMGALDTPRSLRGRPM